METVIKFVPPLPCSSSEEGIMCGRPATAGIATWKDGAWMFHTICHDCLLQIAKVYNVVYWADELKPNKEQPTNGTQ